MPTATDTDLDELESAVIFIMREASTSASPLAKRSIRTAFPGEVPFPLIRVT